MVVEAVVVVCEPTCNDEEMAREALKLFRSAFGADSQGTPLVQLDRRDAQTPFKLLSA